MSRQDLGIDQLIRRIKAEAVDKANDEREALLRDAQEKAQSLIRDAEEQARAIRETAAAEVARDRRELTTELEFAARDFSLVLAERLRAQMFFPIVKESVRATLKEPEFLKQILERLIRELVKDNSPNLDILVPKELRTTLGAFFAGAVFDRLDKNSDVRLLDEEGIEGFILIRRGEHYVWDFRVDTVAHELMRLVEPSLKKYFTAPSKPSVPLVNPVVV